MQSLSSMKKFFLLANLLRRQLVLSMKLFMVSYLLTQLSYTPHAVYTTFTFANTQIPILKKYDEGEAKEGVGAGASLAYAYTHKIRNQELLEQIEYLLYNL